MARRKSFGVRMGERLRAYREAHGWSQAKLAEKVGVTPNYVGILERGRKLPTIDTLMAFARALDVAAAELLDDVRGTDDWIDEVIAVAKAIPVRERALVIAVLKAIASNASH